MSDERGSVWMDAKYPGRCAECEAPLHKGDRIAYDTAERRAYCAACGEEIAGEDPAPRA